MLELMIEQVPGWAYMILLCLAFLLSMMVGNAGLRVVGAVLSRMRRLT